jgi:hypothetical protein
MNNCHVTDTIYNGYRTLFLENSLVKVGILADKGTDIFEFIYKPTQTDFLWKSRLGVRDSRFFIPTIPTRLGSFLDYYEGGWQELFPNTDEACVYKGADLGLHGEICLMPWDVKSIEKDRHGASIRFSVSTCRTPFRLEKTVTLRPDRAVLEFEETIFNEGQEEMDFMWGQHPALGAPFLGEDCYISLPPCKVRTDGFLGSSFSRIAPDQDCAWPFIQGLDGNKIDLRQVPPAAMKCNDRVFLYGFDEGWYAVTNTSSHVGFGMHWDPATFPYLLYWQSFSGWSGYPFYGTAYTMALEPRSSFPFPLSRVIAENTQLKLPAGGVVKTAYQAIAFQSKQSIQSIDDTGEISYQ